MNIPISEFCKKYRLSVPATAKQIRRGKGPEVNAIDGCLYVDEEAKSTLLFLMVTPKDGTPKGGKKNKSQYDVSNNDPDTEADALDAFDNYAQFVGYSYARKLLKERFGVSRINKLDSEHQRIAAKMFDYRSEKIANAKNDPLA